MGSLSRGSAPFGRSTPGYLRTPRWGDQTALLLALAAVGCAVKTDAPPPTPSTPSVAPLPPGPTVSAGPDWFEDVTAASGLAFTYRNDEDAGRFTILESLGGGIGLLDYDGDGKLDVFAVGGGFFDKDTLKGHPCKLFRNRGDCKFEDVTVAVGLGGVDWWYTHGVAVADYDRDGRPDLLVTGFGRVRLFRNDGGKRFVDVSDQTGLKDESWATSAGWGDLDGDGFPDLYVCHYCDWSPTNNPKCFSSVDPTKRDICPPQRFGPLKHLILKNEKGERFRDVTAELGATGRGRGLGVVFADLNADAKPDVYVASDMDFNILYLNRGGGKLEERGMLAAVAADDHGRPEGSMGVDVGDYDGTGRASLWVTNFQGELHALYRNTGRDQFHHQSRATGIAAIGQAFVGFGTGFLDIDADGWEDLVVANGHVMRNMVLGSEYRQRPVLLKNVEHQGRRFFAVASGRGGPFFRQPALGRGLVVGDLDDDGRPDLVISHANTPVAVLRNVADAAPWLGVKLVGKGNRDVAGSTVTVETATRTLTRFVKGGGSYLSAPDPRSLFGLGSLGPVKRVTVRWAWGESQSWDGLAAGSYWELREGEPAAKRAGG